MKQKVLIINICKEKLHYFEFVKPIEDILKNSNQKTKNIKFFTKHYTKLNSLDVDKADRIIICGTSLKDNDFAKDENIAKFNWIKTNEKPILGICGGMQIISLLYRGEIAKTQEIGFFIEEFNKEFLSIGEKHEVYHLHNNYVTLPKNFISYTKSKIPQAIKHETGEIYGVLFHPEVRNKELILYFVKQ